MRLKNSPQRILRIAAAAGLGLVAAACVKLAGSAPASTPVASAFERAGVVVDEDGGAPDREAILETIDAFFLALAAGDADAVEALAAPDALTVIHAPGRERPVRYSRNADFVAAIREERAPAVVEPYWSPLVLQRKSLAIVWAPYQVSVGDQLIHCGVDVFTLSHHQHHDDQAGWKIDALSYTAEPQACEELWPADKSVFRPTFP